jgi:tetratricopeptide (TPR) repeat protein
MTQPEATEAIPPPDPEHEAPDAGAPEVEEPQPEPWTPERVLEWNAYYDLYVMLGVLLLAFVAASNRIAHSAIWADLQVGRIIAATGAPVTTDLFSFTEEGKPWVNVSWLYDLSHALVYRLAYDLHPVDPADPQGSAARADQLAAGVLIGLDALARLLTAWFLMRVRRAGPGLWWSAVCTALALGAVVSPVGLVVIGGIAGPGQVSPEAWGLLLLAVEVWLLHRAVYLGRRGSAYALVPLFAVWANVDESFLIGLLVLAATAVGRMKPANGEEPGALGLSTALVVLAASTAACVLNPSHVHVFAAALDPFVRMFRPSSDVQTIDRLSFFGQGIRWEMGGTVWLYLLGYYVAVVAVGLGSFALNRRRFSLSRFLVYAVAAVLWGVLIKFGREFAVVFAATLALNGQEWYLDTFGERGRLGTGWSLWSVGGRAVTILALFGCVALAITGFGRAYGDLQFGFSYDPGDFAFEAADYLKGAPIHGPVLNTTTAQGDALIWRAYPQRKTAIDDRPHLFPPDALNRIQDLRRALSDDVVEEWKPMLDRYQATAVMVPAASSPRTIRVLSVSPNWVPFYDDGNVVMFGRSDAPEPDLAYFKANRLDPETRAFKTTSPTPAPERPPTPVTWMDKVFQARALERPQPHTGEALRWLSPPSSDPNSAPLPDPARCLLAVRAARTALAAKPDDNMAFRLLAEAYHDLMVQEAALMAGIALTPENAAQIRQLNPRPDLLMNRFRQRVTALNFAIQTTPPPSSAAARADLRSLNFQLFSLFIAANFQDLARDRLQAVLDASEPADLSADQRGQFAANLAQLNERVKEVQNRMGDLTVEQQYGPVQLAGFALSQGAPGLAIHELEEAERTGTNPALVKPQLLDLYCDTGQPDKAMEILSSGTIGDPSFGSEQGVAELRQARAYFLFGNYEYAATLWEKYAIPKLRYDRTNRALVATQALLRGEAKATTATYLELPEKIGLQASWEFDAGLCRLEAGTPELAAEHFTKALTLAPRIGLRPVIAYYLEKLGKPVPAAPPAEGEATRDDQAKPKAPTEPSEPSKEKAKDEKAEPGKETPAK